MVIFSDNNRISSIPYKKSTVTHYKKLSICRVTAQCAMPVEILSPTAKFTKNRFWNSLQYASDLEGHQKWRNLISHTSLPISGLQWQCDLEFCIICEILPLLRYTACDLDKSFSFDYSWNHRSHIRSDSCVNIVVSLCSIFQVITVRKVLNRLAKVIFKVTQSHQYWC